MPSTLVVRWVELEGTFKEIIPEIWFVRDHHDRYKMFLIDAQEVPTDHTRFLVVGWLVPGIEAIMDVINNDHWNLPSLILINEILLENIEGGDPELGS